MIVMIILNRKKKSFFTLLELIISLGVLSLILVISMQFLSTSQQIWKFANNKQNSSMNARIALNMISRDLQSVYYGDDSSYAPFWHCYPQKKTAWKEYRNELLAFVGTTSVPPNDVCTSDLYEIKYQNYYYDGTSKTDKELNGWLRRSITGNMSTKGENRKWNFFSNYSVSYGNKNSAFTANSNSSDSYQKLIPYVTNLSFTCYDKNGDIIPAQVPSNNTSSQYNLEEDTKLNLDGVWTNELNVPYFAPPYSINITLSLMDKESWNKWISMISKADRKNLNPYIEDINNENKNAMNQTAAYRFRIKNQRIFSSTVFIGNRGQYE
jgi:type II secretory pathway pseudopilin PulG